MSINRLVHVGLGANLGHAKATLLAALADLGTWANQGSSDAAFRHSRLYRSASIGGSGPDYINAVAEFNSSLSADELLAYLQGLELANGRTRPFPNAPRTLDLDLLLISQESIQRPHLIVPHPRMTQRAFVLKPLVELQPKLKLFGKDIELFLKQTADQDCELVSIQTE
jgi:2-amino-4-hydroxy-6-hydroxymethyldihydropteridine diphosphokinase